MTWWGCCVEAWQRRFFYSCLRSSRSGQAILSDRIEGSDCLLDVKRRWLGLARLQAACAEGEVGRRGKAARPHGTADGRLRYVAAATLYNCGVIQLLEAK